MSQSTLKESEHFKAVSANIKVGTWAPRFELKWTTSDFAVLMVFEGAFPPPLLLPLTPRQCKRAKAKEKRKAAKESEFCHRFLRALQRDESKVVVDSGRPERSWTHRLKQSTCPPWCMLECDVWHDVLSARPDLVVWGYTKGRTEWLSWQYVRHFLARLRSGWCGW